jgi:threonine dehydratase
MVVTGTPSFRSVGYIEHRSVMASIARRPFGYIEYRSVIASIARLASRVPLPSPRSVLTAANRLKGVVRRTALRRSDALSEIAGTEVLLKLECTQLTGSFKIRGAFNACAAMAPDERARGVVASSAGNHGLGVAYAAQYFRAPAMIFVPETIPAVKRDGIARLGARIDSTQPHYDAAMTVAIAYAQREHMLDLHPCLGDDLLAGQGTVAVEILDEEPRVRAVVVPVGGGGLVGGVAGFLRGAAPNVRVLGAQSAATNAMATSLDAGHVVEIPNLPTLADGLAGQIDEAGLEIGRAALDGMAVVSEGDIARAIVWLAETEDLVVEGSGAVGIAALMTGALGSLEGPVAVVVSGGNIDRERHERILRGER